MKTAFFSVVVSMAILGTCLAVGQSSTKSMQYLAPDGRARVVVVPIGKETGHVDSESRIEFRSDDNHLICALDYSSKDGEHGFGVAKAQWTPDSRYLFSVSLVREATNLGMHQLSSTAEKTESCARSMTIFSQEYPKLTFN